MMQAIAVRHHRIFHAPHELRTVLERECARADRQEQAVSLVLFETNGLQDRSRKRLERIISRCSRVTDEAGRYDEHRFCAILPATSAAGAECFAERVVRIVEEEPAAIRWSISTYPQDDLLNGGGGDGRNDGRGPGGRGHGSHRKELGGRPLMLEAVSSSARSAATLPQEMRCRRTDHEVQPIDAIWCRPMPWWKRTMDIIGAVVGLVLFLPIMLLIAAAIKLTSRGPIFFKQERAGWGNRPFTIYKFRTMCINAESQKAALRPMSVQDGPAFKIPDDPRVTLVGRFLRQTSLDELPQFWNVLIGNMSLVGPRPLPIEESEGCLPWQRQRLCVMPGLTCIWQVRGRSSVKFDDWMRMDMEYIRNHCFWNDFRLLFLTIPAVITRRGAH